MNLVVYPSGVANWNEQNFRCALGAGGISKIKCEGDSITPAGKFSLRHVFFRADRIERPETVLPTTALTKIDGWSDDPDDPDYNRRITLPSTKRHEILWRTDAVYDLIVVIGYNDQPVVSGAGSAIFLHVAKAGYSSTEGCVAFMLSDLQKILREWTETSVVDIQI
ncbi:MAG: L,D-transpeptidase family protein [Alphaproteobacteria bacterium]|nr:L,D-transpeptidase family protein [Alphaproteobacteria bacterium]